MDIYRSIIVVSWVAFILVWIVTGFSAKRSVAGSFMRGFGWRILALVVVAWLASNGVFTGVSLHRILYTFGQPFTALGALLSVVGVAFAIWARLYLGSNWGMPMTLRENPELVTSGPYAYVRHPIYSGLLLAILGSALAIGLVWLIPLAFASGYFLYSARREERDMLREFPDTYPAYKARTRMLVPFLL